MNFNLEQALPILERTPSVVATILKDLPSDWIYSNEGEETWSPYDVVGHYIHGEKTDWIPRMNIILSDEADNHFVPFDRFAQFKDSQGKTLNELLNEFAQLRAQNISKLKAAMTNEELLQKKGIHPAFGEVTLEELLASWVVHDLGHISQTVRTMAKQYTDAVGPWTAYMGILNR
jgi:hypothetical protein